MIDAVRRIVIFLLGLAIICYATAQDNGDLSNYIFGSILIGLVPLDVLLSRFKSGA